MNSSEIITELSKRLNLSKVEATKRANTIAEIITSELLEENILSLGNLGQLQVKKRNERISVSPTTGKKMLIPPKLIVKFKVSSSLKEKVKQIKL